MFILSSISKELEFWSVNQNSESNVFENIKLLAEISKNWSNDLLGTNVYKSVGFCW